MIDRKSPAIKDSVLLNLIPDNISECAIYLQKTEGAACMSDSTLNLVGEILNIPNSKHIINEAKNKLDCEDERCVLTKLSSKIGSDRVKQEIDTSLKINGPTDVKLLSNINIDSILKQYAVKYHTFYPYNFNMLNYASYSYNEGYINNTPDSLSTILFSDLYTGEILGKKYNHAACVINSDVYQGGGKHWMALFADARDDHRWTIEFFNSSGNPPAPEFVSWLIKTKNAMELLHDKLSIKNCSIEIVKVCDIRHQQSRTECGLYSLFYIWARLNKIPFEYFTTNHIPDQLMFEFRAHLFNDPGREKVQKFDWNKYTSQVKVLWE